MKSSSTKKLFAFISGILMFFAIPQISNAQKPNKNRFCPPCYRWYKGDCVPCRSCCTWLSFTLSPVETSSALFLEPEPINFPLSEAGQVSIKIFDATGKLIKTFAHSRMMQGEHQIAWDRNDEQGNAVSEGVYILRFDAGSYSEIKKITVINSQH